MIAGAMQTNRLQQMNCSVHTPPVFPGKPLAIAGARFVNSLVGMPFLMLSTVNTLKISQYQHLVS